MRGRKLLLAFVLTTLTMLAEVAGGLWSGSLALLTDGGHMMVDALALLMAFMGARMALRPADARRSYGYGRMEVLVGFVNALSQFVLVAWVADMAAWNALVQRLFTQDANVRNVKTYFSVKRAKFEPRIALAPRSS